MATIHRVAAGLESLGSEKITFTVGHTKEGFECIQFVCNPMFLKTIKSYSLFEASKEGNVSVLISIEGGLITNNLSHVCMGFKINDVGDICPNIGKAKIILA